MENQETTFEITTNCTPNGETVSLALTKEQIRDLYLSYGNGQGYLLDGYFLEDAH